MKHRLKSDTVTDDSWNLESTSEEVQKSWRRKSVDSRCQVSDSFRHQSCAGLSSIRIETTLPKAELELRFNNYEQLNELFGRSTSRFDPSTPPYPTICWASATEGHCFRALTTGHSKNRCATSIWATLWMSSSGTSLTANVEILGFMGNSIVGGVCSLTSEVPVNLNKGAYFDWRDWFRRPPFFRDDFEI
ncbi:hypothetical protein J6590_043428 [Homalodisca vitripennis]|nr:hypothetical protein J6590_043428 [Homalodisca vitripennis]